MARSPRPSGSVVALKFAPDARFDEGDEEVARMAMRMLVGIRAHAQTATKELLNGMVHSMNAVLDAKDPYTAGHSERVARIAVLLGKQLGLSPTTPRRPLPRRPPPRSRQDRRSRRGAVENRASCPLRSSTRSSNTRRSASGSSASIEPFRRLCPIRPAPPRTVRRNGLPGRPFRRGDSAARPRARRGRCSRRDDVAAALPAGAIARRDRRR